MLPENAPANIPPGKPTLPWISAESYLEDFVSFETWNFSKLIGIRPTFLELPVEQWETDSSYVEMKKIVASLRVVNDVAERAVKFGSDYTHVLTKSEHIRQNILQGVELARRAFPHATRKCYKQVNASSAVPEVMKAAKYDARN